VAARKKTGLKVSYGEVLEFWFAAQSIYIYGMPHLLIFVQQTWMTAKWNSCPKPNTETQHFTIAVSTKLMLLIPISGLL
jgi:hypothetical protein